MRSGVRREGQAVKVILSKRMYNRTKFMGKVSEVSDTSFTMTCQQTGEPMKLAYQDVQIEGTWQFSEGTGTCAGIKSQGTHKTRLTYNASRRIRLTGPAATNFLAPNPLANRGH